VFDSGVGGLSVLKAIRQELPRENLLYVGDSGFAPYGDKPHDVVQARADAITRYLIDAGAKAIVVACNTATGIAVDALRSSFPAVPIVAIEPAVKPAAARTKTGVVGVLATAGTLASANVTRLLNTYGVDVEILTQVGTGLVEQVEKGELSSDATRNLIKQAVDPLTQKGADVLVLGCTHYPFLSDEIRRIAGPGVELIDPATAVARELHRRLRVAGLLELAQGSEQFYTTGDARTVSATMSRLWGIGVEARNLKLETRN
jgi:glutamate racemase